MDFVFPLSPTTISPTEAPPLDLLGNFSPRNPLSLAEALQLSQPLKLGHDNEYHNTTHKKLSYCWETVRRESMPRIAEMDVEMTT